MDTASDPSVPSGAIIPGGGSSHSEHLSSYNSLGKSDVTPHCRDTDLAGIELWQNLVSGTAVSAILILTEQLAERGHEVKVLLEP